MQAMQMLLPLLALPWLARILGPDAFGILMYLCLLPPLIALFIDWGLALGGCRKAAALRGDDPGLSRLLGAVLSAKMLLILCCVALCLAIGPCLPYAAAYPGAYAMAVTAGIARGMNPAWFFQGTGQGLPRMAAFDIAASSACLAAVFLFIHKAAAWPLYLLFIAACKIMAYGWILFRLISEYRPELSFHAGIGILRQTAPLFGSAFSLMLCYNGGQLILGMFLQAQDMGIIAACMKMLRAFASLVLPFTQTLFPELCLWRRRNMAHARQVLRLSLLCTALAALAAACLAAALTPWLIKIALGPEYATAIPALRIMLIAAPAMILNNVLSCQILVPFEQEKAQLAVQACCALLSMPLAAALAIFGGVSGGAFLPFCCECLMLAGFTAAILKRCPAALFSSAASAKDNPGSTRQRQ